MTEGDSCPGEVRRQSKVSHISKLDTNKKYSKKYVYTLVFLFDPEKFFVFLQIFLKCANKNKLDSVTEPNTCQYQVEFQTPLACPVDAFLGKLFNPLSCFVP